MAALEVEIPAADGVPLAASAFDAPPSPRRPPVLVLSATGVARGFWRDALRFLAEAATAREA